MRPARGGGVWALFAAERTDSVGRRARAALGGATAAARRPSRRRGGARAAGCIAPQCRADARALVVGEPTRPHAPALSRVPLPAGLALVRGGRVDAGGVVFVDRGAPRTLPPRGRASSARPRLRASAGPAAVGPVAGRMGGSARLRPCITLLVSARA